MDGEAARGDTHWLLRGQWKQRSASAMDDGCSEDAAEEEAKEEEEDERAAVVHPDRDEESLEDAEGEEVEVEVEVGVARKLPWADSFVSSEGGLPASG